MLSRRHLLGASAGLAATGALYPIAANAQPSWPTQPVRLVVPYAPGGPTDVPARLIADELSKSLPQRVIVENRTGSGVVIGTDVVSKAPKDGHTLLYTTISHATLRAIFKNLPFDPVGDFTPVALTGVIPMILMTGKSMPGANLREVIAAIKEKPGEYTYGSSGAGGALHLAAELFLLKAGGLKANHIPYRGSAAAMPDLLNGNLSMMLDVAASALPFVQRGIVKGIAVSSAARIPQAPDLPTFQEAGLAGYEAYTWHMVLAPSGTPPTTIEAINTAINGVMANAAVRQRLQDLTMQTRSDSTPESAKAWLQEELQKWEPINRDAGITAN